MGWQTYTISEIGRVVTGRTPRTSETDLFGSDFPFITPTDMGGSRYCETERGLSSVGAERQRSLMLPARSVCVTCIASIGKMCMTQVPSFTNQQINSVVVDESRFDPFFVYYSLLRMAPDLARIAGGAATPIINKTSFSGLHILAPPLPDQRRLAKVLSAYDDVIHNCERRSRVLGQMRDLLLPRVLSGQFEPDIDSPERDA